LALAGAGLGCASSGPNITTHSAPGTDFARFRTFDFMQPLGTDRDNGVRTPLSALLIDSMTRQLTSRGLSQSDAPDLLVNFFAMTQDRVSVRTVPTAGVGISHHPSRRSRYSTWGGYRTTVREYTRGTLSIDLVDAGENMLVWEGVAQDRLRDDPREITQAQIDGLIEQLLAELTLGSR
jgi:hypothetical protein